MFEQTLLTNNGLVTKPWTMLVSLTGQCALVGVAILAPLIVTDNIRPVQLANILTAPAPPPPPPPPAVAVPTTTARAVVRQFVAGVLLSPVRIPERIAQIIDDPTPPPAGVTWGVPGGVEGGVPGGVLHGVLTAASQSLAAAAPPPPPPPVAKPAETPKITRITVGGVVQQARVIDQPLPVYPPLARQARVQGTVHLEGIISREGRIISLRAISGHPMLIPAAIEAVKRWVYRPTLLNGDPVEVIAPIDVNFTLN